MRAGDVMDEREWLACANPDAMLRDLKAQQIGIRKFRLFAIACCRRIWSLLTDECGRRAVAVAEQLAEESPVKEDELAELRSEAWYRSFKNIDGFRTDRRGQIAYHAINTACCALQDERVFRGVLPAEIWERDILDAAREAAWALTHWHRKSDEDNYDLGILQAEMQKHVPLLRCIFGDPFRPVQVEPAWRSWQDHLIPRLAEVLYDQHDPESGLLDNDRLAILADALEEVGCCDTAILEHCRTRGEHPRGCWVVDALRSVG